MGYYDDEGQHHSFRHGIRKAAENLVRPRYRESIKEEIYVSEPSRGSHHSHSHGAAASVFTVPCHHIRTGDLVILQHRPCQIIRISTSTTGQHRYLGVDLFTRQLYEEPCVVSHPEPSVITHSMLAPQYKQYRVIDIAEDGRVVAMTETGDVKTGLRVVDQSGLFDRLSDAFENGRGAARVLVVQDRGEELVVDFRVAPGGRL
jgi:hypothetical protein